MTAADTAFQAQVDAQLLEQGAFAPLELLFNSGRLLYSDYESWRRGEIEYLDSVLMGNVDKIKGEIEQAIGYARRIKLVEQTQEFHAWHTQDAATDVGGARERPLRISMDSQLQRLIGSRYVRAQSVPQMDLFFDNPVVALTNGIVQSLTTRNLANTQRQLDQLYAQAPTHADLAAFDQLLAALGRLGHPVEEPRHEIAFLLEVTPTARRLLGSQSRDLLAPLWIQLAQALGNAPFDPNEPTLHRTFALSQAQDWSAVSDAVLSEPTWQHHAPLCLRLVESSFNRRQRVTALTAWSHLCWHTPSEAAPAITKLRHPELTTLWQRFLDDESDLSDHSANAGAKAGSPSATASAAGATARSTADVATPSAAGATARSTADVAAPSTAGATARSTADVAAPSAAGATARSTADVAAPSTAGASARSTTGVATPSAAGATARSTADVAVPSTAGATARSTADVATPSTASATAGSSAGAAAPSTAGATAGSTVGVATASAVGGSTGPAIGRAPNGPAGSASTGTATIAGPTALTEIDFPAWLLLQEPGLSLQLAEDLPTGTPAEDSYRCVHRWTHARRSRNQTEELALRKVLQAIHPALFQVLKRSV